MRVFFFFFFFGGGGEGMFYFLWNEKENFVSNNEKIVQTGELEMTVEQIIPFNWPLAYIINIHTRQFHGRVKCPSRLSSMSSNLEIEMSHQKKNMVFVVHNNNLHRPSIQWNHPTITHVLPSSWWISLSISIEAQTPLATIGRFY